MFDVESDAEFAAEPDAVVDAERDAGFDAASDAEFDAELDAGSDAELDERSDFGDCPDSPEEGQVVLWEDGVQVELHGLNSADTDTFPTGPSRP